MYRSIRSCGQIFILSALLCGCQTAVQPQTQTSQTQYGAAADVAVTRHNQYRLYDDRGFDPAVLPSNWSPTISSNAGRLSFDQEGDAVEFLAELARLRGLQFTYSGVRLPLPLSIHARGMTFENALRLVKAQTAWRATLTQEPGLLHLAFMPVKEGTR